ncbi:MAG: hypothetical protein PHV37_01470 [Candidatus Gastranaerophilales bacterium]|nr:hypothetical protein [Candidatus Gastranaerophilales bacterium]
MKIGKISNALVATPKNKMPKVTKPILKQATKNEQAAMDSFQKATTGNQQPLFINRRVDRMLKKLHKSK